MIEAVYFHIVPMDFWFGPYEHGEVAEVKRRHLARLYPGMTIDQHNAASPLVARRAAADRAKAAAALAELSRQTATPTD